MTRRSPLSGAWIQNSLIFVLVFFLLVWINAHLLDSGDGALVGDLAADMLLGNALSRNEGLLVGHYSRWQFNHPGPFWFYLNYGFEWLLAGLNLTRFQVWVIGSVVTNAVLITAGSIVFSRFLFSRPNGKFALLFAAIWIGFCGAEITLLWMPWRIVVPYFCFLVAVLHLSEGRVRAFFPASFLAGVLIHGYVTMPIFTLPFLFWGGWMGQRKNRCMSDNASLGWLILGGLSLLFFVLPIAREAMGPAPSNLARILQAQSLLRQMQRPSGQELLEFGWALLRMEQNRGAWVASITLLMLIPAWIRCPSEQRRLMMKTWMLAGAVTLGVLGYYARTPSPLYPFVAQFFVMIPVMVLGTWSTLAVTGPGKAPSLKFLGRFGSFAQLLPLILVVGFLLTGLQRPPRLGTSASLSGMADFLSSTQDQEVVALSDFREEGWPFMAGLLLELERRGVRVCTTDWSGELIYTKFHLCSADTIPQYALVVERECEGRCLYHEEGQGLRRVDLPVLLPNTPLEMQSSHALFLNWNESPQGIWWTTARMSSILFQIAETASYEGVLDLDLSSIGTQRVVIAWNGREIFNDRLAKSRMPLHITFPPEWIRHGPNSLAFLLPDARRPSAEDLRTLALKVNKLTIH